MINVHCSSDVFFSVNKEDMEILQKTHDILDDVRHSWNIKDNNAWDYEDYWELDNAVKMLERLFNCNSKK